MAGTGPGSLDELSRTLRELRHAAGLSGMQAAERVGFSQAKISRIEKGINVPTAEDVEALAKTYRAATDTRRHLVLLAEDVKAANRRVVLSRRQAVLDEPGRRITVLTTEGALGWAAGEPKMMLRQLEHIEVVASKPNVQVGIIPFGVPRAVFPVSNYNVFDERAVVPGILRTQVVLVDSDVPPYVDQYVKLEQHAVFGDAANAILTQTSDRYRSM